MTRSLVTALLLGVFSAGCAPTGPDDGLPTLDPLDAALQDRGLLRDGRLERVPGFSIEGWQSLDDRALIVTGRRDARYLVTLATFCQGLSTAFEIGLASATSSLSSTDDILVRDVGGRVHRCPIFGIERLVEIRQGGAST